MKNFTVLLLSLILMVSCARKVEEPKEPEDDFLKVPTYETPAYTPATTYTPIYQTQSSSSTPTYWYITFEEIKPGDEQNIDWHRAIKLPTPYFYFVEARKALPVEVTGEIYFDFIVQINKESYESYYVFRELYYKK